MRTLKRFTISDDPVKEYAAELDAAESLTALRKALEPWETIAWDALDTVNTWTDNDFTDWRKALAIERHGHYMGDGRAKRFAVVLMPETMFQISMIAERFKVPWVIARRRLEDARTTYRAGRRLKFRKDVL